MGKSRHIWLNNGQFLRKLSGVHARGPELGSIKVNNSIYSARNIYVINGRMWFLTMYDKARKRRGNTEYIVRCLPDEVGQTICLGVRSAGIRAFVWGWTWTISKDIYKLCSNEKNLSEW
jgi:hypothetical protein